MAVPGLSMLEVGCWMFRSHCFQLDDEAVIHEHVGAIVANERAVLENALTD
jgi:hypothetical protein